jgi:pilus assembly protein CpaF
MVHLRLCDKQGGESVISISHFPFTIGKLPDNDLPLDRTNISRRHCQLIQKEGRIYLQDLGSRNGTFVGGRRVEDSCPLEEGGEIHLGDFVIRFHERPPAPPVPSAKPPVPPKPVPGGEAETPVALKRKIHHQLIEELDLKHADFSASSTEEMRRRVSEVAERLVERFASEVPAGVDRKRFCREILDEALGLGPLEELLADPEVDEIMVNNWDRIYVERKGKLHLTPKRFTGNDQLLNIIRRIIAPLGRRVDEASPMVDARLSDGSRVNAIISPLSLKGPTLTIRKFSKTPFRVDDLARFGSLSDAMGRFLKLAVGNRLNLLISGGTGSGKTTLLNVVSGFIPEGERIVTIEDAAELRLGQEHVVSLESRPPNIEGEGAIPIRKLVINALRMRPDRIVVGECRGGEALDMLQAMNTGHDGSLTTLHANNPRDALARLETLVLMAGMELPARSIRQQIASAIHLIVQIARLSDGSRKVTSIQEITGMEGEVITLQELFRFQQEGIDAQGKVKGAHQPTRIVPKFVHGLRAAGRPVDLALFQ